MGLRPTNSNENAVVTPANRSLWSRLGNNVPKPSRDQRERLAADG
jgi:hypothetical protein